MKRVPACAIAILILTAFLSLPAAAAEIPAASPQVATPEVLFAAGRPAEFPSQGNACRIPRPFQPESCICPFVFEPVCGCNGQTYSNACFARCEVRFFTEGACDGGGAA
ncbi:MAG TPA: Kazal-type serine protease inhibitor [Thermoanaerobaculia bacterium]|jgi:hypothetical protein|nr:Kazal-type serine protease inhibitor [Thermoanaerobaculia bacterium]